MEAVVYRGPYMGRVEEKDMPAIEHPNDAIVRELILRCALDPMDDARDSVTPTVPR